MFTIAALRAAKAAEGHIKAPSYVYHPEEAAVSIDELLRLPQLLELISTMVDEAKRDLASSPDWTGPTVRISRGKLKEISNLLQYWSE